MGFEDSSESDESEPPCMHDEHELLFDVEELRWENREAELMERRASAVHANHDLLKSLSQVPVLEANVQAPARKTTSLSSPVKVRLVGWTSKQVQVQPACMGTSGFRVINSRTVHGSYVRQPLHDSGSLDGRSLDGSYVPLNG